MHEIQALLSHGISLPSVLTLATQANGTGVEESPDVFTLVIHMLTYLTGGLGIFLLGMKHMSEGLQAVAGASLRRMISAVTNNRLMAAGVGTTVTCIVQSSSITTVMVVGFVNSGLMSLTQAIGVIMGANIGTTITGWILVLKVGKYGLPILGVAAFVYLFARKDRWKYSAGAVMGIGMIFFGLELMKQGVGIIEEIEQFKKAFEMFAATSYIGVLKCAMLGCFLTLLVQSSSATLGITIALASTGVIDFPTAAALVLGENIGTTITAILASIGTTTNAKRAAYFHVLFNITGVFWITLLFQPYIWLIGEVREVLAIFLPAFGGEDPTASIALTHSGFNIANTLLFLPFVGFFASFLMRMLPDRGIKEKPHLTSLDVRMLETPVLGVEQSRTEVLRMGTGVNKMLTWIGEAVTSSEIEEDKIQTIFNREEVLDKIQHEIMEFMTDMLSGNVPHAISEESREQVRLADEYESISDVLVSILKSHLRVRQADLAFSAEQDKRLRHVHDEVAKYVSMVTDAYAKRNKGIITKAHTHGRAINHLVRETRHWHLDTLSDAKCDPLVSMCFTGILQSYRHIKDHALNIAETVAGEK